MAKVDWDKLLGGVADSGIEAFKAGSQGIALAREADRRENLDAFTMGEKIPIIRAPIGGLGGMAKSNIEAEAGLAPEASNYGDFNTVGAIGAAPAPAPSPGPSAVPGMYGGGGGGGAIQPQPQPQAQAPAGNLYAQSRPPVTEADVSQYIGGMREDQRKAFMKGVESNDAKRQQEEVKYWMGHLADPMDKLRGIHAGTQAADQVIKRNEAMIAELVQADTALRLQHRDNPSPELEKQMVSVNQQIKGLVEMNTKMEEHKSRIGEGADILAAEAQRTQRVLEMLGVEPDLIENYKRRVVEGGDISNARDMILLRIGRGVGIKSAPKAGVGGTNPRQSTPRPLR